MANLSAGINPLRASASGPACLSLEDADRLIAQYVLVYSEQRLHSAIGYVTPKAALEGRRGAIQEERDHKLELARQQREQQPRPPLPERTKSTVLSTEAAA